MRLLLFLAPLLLLTACAERDPEPAVPTPPPAPDTVQTPLAVPDPALQPTGLSATEAVAELEPVGGSDAQGYVRFYEAEEGVRVIAEVGGLSEGQKGLRVLARQDCEDLSDLRPYSPETADRPAGRLDNLEVGFDGRGRYEQVEPALRLEGDRSVVGRVAAVIARQSAGETQPDAEAGEAVACGVIRAVDS